MSEITVSTVRAWNQNKGLPVGVRGRISRAAVDAYNKAHPRNKFTGEI